MKQTCFILEWTDLPEEFKDEISEREVFHNDCYLSLNGELDGEEVNMESIMEYYEDQVENNNFKGTLDEFIKDYGLSFEHWITQQGFDLKGVDRILIEVSW